MGGGGDGVANSESNSVSLNVYYLNVKDQGLGSFMPPQPSKKARVTEKRQGLVKSGKTFESCQNLGLNGFHSNSGTHLF